MSDWYHEELVHKYAGREHAQIYLTTKCTLIIISSTFKLLTSYLISIRTRPDAYNVMEMFELRLCINNNGEIYIYHTLKCSYKIDLVAQKSSLLQTKPVSKNYL